MPRETLSSEQLLKQANEQLNLARDALGEEIQAFAREKSQEMGPQESSGTINRMLSVWLDWPDKKTWSTSLLSFLDLVEASQAKESARQLLETARWLNEELVKRFDAIGNVEMLTLVDLVQKTNVLSDFSEMWTVYRTSWVQRFEKLFKQTSLGRQESEDKDRHQRSIEAANKVTQEFYKAAFAKNLTFKQKHQVPIVVPFGSRLYTSGFEAPMPYIVAPAWGHRQSWTWLAYPHEVGHYIYRGVEGLSDELKVHVAIALAFQGKDYTIQCVWFNWLEEVFSDVFGLTQVHVASARAQQRMLILRLPLDTTAHLKANDRKRLLYGADDMHPVPYLRGYLATKALKMLDIPDERIKPLRETWANVFSRTDMGHVFPRIRGVTERVSTLEMEQAGDAVLDVILNTPLYALADKNNVSSPRTLKDVFPAEPSLEIVNVKYMLVELQEQLDSELANLHIGADRETVLKNVKEMNETFINRLVETTEQ